MLKSRFAAALLGCALASLVVVPSFARAPNELRSNNGRAGMYSYAAIFTGYAAYATPTDLAGICGATGRTVFVTNAYLNMGSTSAALQTISFIKRSTADSGGTSAAVAGVAYDVNSVAPLATVKTYSVVPTTLGTTVGTIRVVPVLSGVLAGNPGLASLNTAPFNAVNTTHFQRPVVLNGPKECLYMNYGGGALTSGFTSSGGFEWAEF